MIELVYLFFLLGSGLGSLYQDIECLSVNIYHEARGESIEGQIAVGNVVLNRVKDYRYPNTVCGVVKQAEYDPIKYIPILNRCHFSWFCDGKSDRIKDNKRFLKVFILSTQILLGNVKDNTNNSTHYFNPHKAQPRWAEVYTFKTQINNHEFYERT